MQITGGIEILQIVDAVAGEKGIEQESVFVALEDAVEAVSRRKYGAEHNITAEISRRTGEISLFQLKQVVDRIEDFDTQIELKEAKDIDPEAVVEGEVRYQLPPIEFGRVNSQFFKQVMTGSIRAAEREKEYEEFKDRTGEIITGVVKRVENGNVIVEFGSTETFLPKDETIPREQFRPGDRIRAVIINVRRENKKPQIILSRSHPEFLGQLFAQEVPEIYDGLVTVKAVVRDPGSRAKIAVAANDASIDPVGACIGPRGARVSSVYNELQGEKIDIIEWSPDLAGYAVSALTSKTREMAVEVSKIVIDEDAKTIMAVVPDVQLSLAIGRRGQNVRLASQLLGWNIDVMSETDESEKRTRDFDTATQLFVTSMNVDEVIAQLLASEGFKAVEEIAYSDIEDLAEIEGFDEDIAAEIQNRAVDFMNEKNKELAKEWKALGVEQELYDINLVTDALMLAFGNEGIKNLEDLGEIDINEFIKKFSSLGYGEEEALQILSHAKTDDEANEENDTEIKEDVA